MQKLDSMERMSSTASKDAQTYEAQLQGMHRQLKEAQAAARVFEQNSEKVSNPAGHMASQPQRMQNPACIPLGTSSLSVCLIRTTSGQCLDHLNIELFDLDVHDTMLDVCPSSI